MYQYQPGTIREECASAFLSTGLTGFLQLVASLRKTPLADDDFREILQWAIRSYRVTHDTISARTRHGKLDIESWLKDYNGTMLPGEKERIKILEAFYQALLDVQTRFADILASAKSGQPCLARGTIPELAVA